MDQLDLSYSSSRQQEGSMESLKELYRIGPGPSSSHTLAIQNGCLFYLKKYPNFDHYKVVCYGSLALTGKGHGTDKIIEKTFGQDKVEIEFNIQMVEDHPNTMMLYTVENGQLTNQMVIYSTGGGAFEAKGYERIVDNTIYPHNSMDEILDFCKENHFNLAQYVYNFEPEIKSYLAQVLQQMLLEVRNGIGKTGTLPGPLKIEKIAKKIYEKALDSEDQSLKNDLLLTSYAYGAMEENACGQQVVTAPTLGSCGVVAAMINYYFDNGLSRDILTNGLAVAGIIGNLIKTNASISGAVLGCQAEIGSACCMAAAMAAYFEGLSNKQIEYAAEIAMEHNLGLPCDPVGGYVQVPCIERNGVAVLRAQDCMNYAKVIGSLKENKVSFDMIVKAMNYTGQRLPMELRETSLGGLAILLKPEEQK